MCWTTKKLQDCLKNAILFIQKNETGLRQKKLIRKKTPFYHVSFSSLFSLFFMQFLQEYFLNLFQVDSIQKVLAEFFAFFVVCSRSKRK